MCSVNSQISSATIMGNLVWSKGSVVKGCQSTKKHKFGKIKIPGVQLPSLGSHVAPWLHWDEKY